MMTRQAIILDAVASALRSFRWLSLGLLAVYLLSSTTLVQPGEVALVLRCGRLVGTTPDDQIRLPGLLLALPFPIDRVIRIPIKEEGEVAINDLWKSLNEAASLTNTIDPLKEGYCLTGDQNILQARVIARYRIDEPIKYAFRVDRPRELVHDAVMSALTQTIAGWHVDNALRLQQEISHQSLATQVQQATQMRLKAADCGLVLTALEFKEIHPPRHLRAEFEGTQIARVEKETRRREAEGFASSRIPQADAERNRIIQEAHAQASGVRAKASADVSVFRGLLDEYRRNPSSVRERVYRESMQQIMGQIGKRFLIPPRDRAGDVRIYISEPEENR